MEVSESGSPYRKSRLIWSVLEEYLACVALSWNCKNSVYVSPLGLCKIIMLLEIVATFKDLLVYQRTYAYFQITMVAQTTVAMSRHLHNATLCIGADNTDLARQSDPNHGVHAEIPPRCDRIRQEKISSFSTSHDRG